MARLTSLQPWIVVSLALGQLGATCQYSPPPVPSQGQAAKTLGPGRVAVAAEAGWGTSASWWDAKNISDVDVNSGTVGVGRARYGLTDNVDVGLVGGSGPVDTFVLSPEVKWRFAHVHPQAAPGGPSFNGALISGLGLGRSNAACDSEECGDERWFFMAPYGGVLASGGIEVVQMFTGLRLAASRGFEVNDLTFYPLLSFGVQVRPVRAIAIFAEGTVGGGITASDFDDSALLAYPSVGVWLYLDRLWGSR